MTLLSKDAILGVNDLATKDVFVKAWGGTVRLRMLTAGERAAIEDSQVKTGKIDWTDFKARIVSLSAVNEDGSRMFSDEDIVALNGKSAPVIDMLFVEANAINALSNDATDNLEKDSAETQAVGSTGN